MFQDLRPPLFEVGQVIVAATVLGGDARLRLPAFPLGGGGVEEVLVHAAKVALQLCGDALRRVGVAGLLTEPFPKLDELLRKLIKLRDDGVAHVSRIKSMVFLLGMQLMSVSVDGRY